MASLTLSALVSKRLGGRRFREFGGRDHAFVQAQAEPGDSSEWEQTREQLGNPLSMQHTDSPESLMMGAMSRPTAPSDQPQGLGIAGSLEDAHNFDLYPDSMYRQATRSSCPNTLSPFTLLRS